MPITNSTNLNFPLPGAEEGDSRLLDIQAVKAALLSIDTQLGSYLIDNPTPIITITGDIISPKFSLDFTQTNTFEIELFGQNALNGTDVQWTISGLSALSDQNAPAEPGTYSQTSGIVTFDAEYASIVFDINGHEPLDVNEYFQITLVQLSPERNPLVPTMLNFFISSDPAQG